MKTRNILPSPLVALKAVPCPCGWFVAARSYAELLTAGWQYMFNGPGIRRFICATCQAECLRSLAVGGPEAFAALQAAPPHAFPRIGGKGEKHRNTSRPAGAKVVPVPAKNAPAKTDDTNTIASSNLNSGRTDRWYIG